MQGFEALLISGALGTAVAFIPDLVLVKGTGSPNRTVGSALHETSAPPFPSTTPTASMTFTTFDRAGASASVSEAPASSTSSAHGANDWLSISDTWRAKTGHPVFQLDAGLVANAQDTADSSGGTLQHKLNPGTSAQVMAPGDADNFESVYVGGWLCELPNTAGLADICTTAAVGWDHQGQTGHAEVLLSERYTKIGCALGMGIWVCDLA